MKLRNYRQITNKANKHPDTTDQDRAPLARFPSPLDPAQTGPGASGLL